MNAFHRAGAWLLAACALLLLAGCATGPRISTDVDPHADFSRYRTWAFFQPIAMEQSGYSTFTTQRIRDNVSRQMEARGYVYDESSPDLRVNFQGIMQERTNVFTTPRSDMRFFYSYRHRSYFAVPVWYDETQVDQFTEGTLTLDLVDAAQNRLVWTGSAIGRVTRRTPQERALEIDRAISEIFLRFPFRAGLGQAPAPAADPAPAPAQ